jgi:protein arginine kinase activator
MQCEACQLNPATVLVKQVQDGKALELHLCADCAAAKGITAHSPLSLTDFLFGIEKAEGPRPEPKKQKACTNCHMRAGDFQKISRLGCSRCYVTFAEELKPILADMHRGTRHVGKVPQRHAAAAEISELRRRLELAVGAQDFEQAAQLRDRILAVGTPPGSLVADSVPERGGRGD